jgi:hypothetical protein
VKAVSLASLVERQAALQWLRRRNLGTVVRRKPAEGVTFIAGPFYENRAMRRANGERLYRHGYGAMAPSIRTRGR